MIGRKEKRKNKKPSTKKIIQKLLAWSWSRLTTYRTCPYKAKLLYIDKNKIEPNDAMKRGTAIHKLGEDYIKGNIKRLPKELANFAEEFKDIKADIKKGLIVYHTEKQIAFTKGWVLCDWYSKYTACRAVLDLAYQYIKDMTVLYIIDYKTGKIRVENKEQLDLYALVGFIDYPEVLKVVCEFWYLDQDGEEALVTIEYDRKKDFARLKKHWNGETKTYFNDTKFPPRPNKFCGWCDFRKDKGGQCEY